MVGNDFAYDGKSQSRSVGLSRADKRVEQVVSNGNRDARSVVRDADFERFRRGYNIESDFPLAFRDGLAGIHCKVEQGALHFLRIEDSGHIARRMDGNIPVAQFGARTRGFDGAAHALIDGSVYRGDIEI